MRRRSGRPTRRGAEVAFATLVGLLVRRERDPLVLFLAACNALFIVWPVAMIYRFGESAYWEGRMARAARFLERYVSAR